MLRRLLVLLSATAALVGGLALPASAVPVACIVHNKPLTTVTVCVETDASVRQVYVRATAVVPTMTLHIHEAELWRYSWSAGTWQRVTYERPGSFSGLATVEFYGAIHVTGLGYNFEACVDVDVSYPDGVTHDSYGYVCSDDLAT